MPITAKYQPVSDEYKKEKAELLDLLKIDGLANYASEEEKQVRMANIEKKIEYNAKASSAWDQEHKKMKEESDFAVSNQVYSLNMTITLDFK